MNHNQQRIAEYTEQYMEKIFYFCLRKTGDRFNAEDLTQDISLAVLHELNRGMEPKNFPAWVWQIARNRYARWTDRRHRRSEWESESSLEDCDVADDSSIEADYLHQEALSLLRRELAFISAEYRDIVVAYYIDDRAVRDIAQSLSLSEGTVKARLFRARNILKEGMNMAREFGKRSYQPENITFIMSGIEGKNGEPYSLIKDLLSKNILLSSYEKPQTAEEIAIETGVALPYVQERLETLVGATLMRKIGHRYAPSFYIVSKDVQECVSATVRHMADKLTDATIIQLVDTERVFHEANGNLPEPNMSAVENNFCDHFTIRPCDGVWDVMGSELYEETTPAPAFVGMHGCLSSLEADYDSADFPRFWQYKFNYHGISDATPIHLSMAEGKVLREIARGNGHAVDTDIRRALEKYGYIAEVDGTWLPTFYVCNHARIKPFTVEQQAEIDRLRKHAVAIVSEMRLTIAEQMIKDAPTHLDELPHAINFAISALSTGYLRGSVLEAALVKGYIDYHDDKDEARERMLGAYLGI